MNTTYKGPLIDPITFNYAIICSAFDLSEARSPKVYIVDYKVSKFSIQRKLPAGRFQAQDLVLAISKYIAASVSRNQDIEYTSMDALALEAKFLRDTSGLTDYNEINPIFDKYTDDMLKLLQRCKSLTEYDFARIVNQTVLNTVRRELKEEIDASYVGELFLSSTSKSGNHFKLSFTTVDIVAPSIYEGSADEKIKKSYLEIIDSETQSLLNGHANTFSAGIRVVINNDLHENVSDLMQFWKAIK